MRELISFIKYLHYVKFVCLLLLAVLLLPENGKAQNDLNVIKGQSSSSRWLHFSNASNSLYNHFAQQAFDHLDKRANTIAKIHTLTDWQKRQKWIKKTLDDIVGPFPKKTPLNARVLRSVKKDDYHVEHIVFESQPGFHVTSSMFIPEGLQEKAPVILYTSGHTAGGYRYEPYQHLILNLVKKGFIVFAFDPVGQGERLEYYNVGSDRSYVGGPTSEHSYSGTQAFITGSSQARYMIWDGIRAVDYLLSRKEVDPKRIGITGMSGGGTQCAYIAAMDERIKAAAPSNYITSFTRLFQSIGPQDDEQNISKAIEQGLDYGDLLSVRAPKPTLMLTTTQDFFSIQGARETAKEVAGIYKAYGKEGDFGMVEDDAGHTVTKKNREALYAFFQRHLEIPGNSDDHEVEILSEEEIQVTKTGQVATSLGGETVFSLNRKDAEKAVNRLQASRKDIIGHLAGVLNAAKEFSGYQNPADFNEPVFTGRIQEEDYAIEKYFVKGEGDYIIPYLLMVPEKPNNKGVIYLHPLGKSAEASTDGEIEQLVKRGFTVLAPDLIGLGESGNGSTNRKEWRASILIGRSIVGIQASDAVRLTRVLEKKTGVGEISGVARREMGPVLLHAAAFEPSIAQVVLIEPYSSYRSVVMNRFYNSGFIHSTVPGALTAYDLPDLAATLAPRKLTIAGVIDSFGGTTGTDDILEDLSFIKTAYKAKKAEEHLNIIARESSVRPLDLTVEWSK